MQAITWMAARVSFPPDPFAYVLPGGASVGFVSEDLQPPHELSPLDLGEQRLSGIVGKAVP